MGSIPLTPGGAVVKLLFDAVLDHQKDKLTPRQYMYLQAVGKGAVVASDAAIIDLMVSIQTGTPLTTAQRAHALQIGKAWGMKVPVSKPVVGPSYVTGIPRHPGTIGATKPRLSGSGILRGVGSVLGWASAVWFFATVESPGEVIEN